MKRIYLDYAATTPVDARVMRAMTPYLTEKFGNPSSLHGFGQEASRAVYGARRAVAESLGARAEELIFTGSATEANNLAMRGVVAAWQKSEYRNPKSEINSKSSIAKQKSNPGLKNFNSNVVSNFEFRTSNFPPRIIISSVEHESVLETARDLEREGVEVIYIPVSKTGAVDLGVLKKSLTKETVLVSVMYANNEMGTIEPISAIADVIRNWKLENGSIKSRSTNYQLPITSYPLFHTDASQALLFLDCSVTTVGVDFMTLSSHKIYGPKGVGVLYMRNSKYEALNSKQIPNPKSKTVSDFDIRISDFPSLRAMVTGGGQESGLRSGTENVPAIVGFAEAVRIALAVREREAAKTGALRDYFWKELKKIYPLAVKNTPKDALPHNLHVWFPGKAAADMLVALDLSGVAVSAGSACAARASEPSHVLQAAGFSEARQAESIRFSLGRPTTRSELSLALRAVRNALKKL